MINTEQVENTLNELFKDSKTDHLNIIKGATKSLLRPMKPEDFEDAYLSISKDQGEYLVQLIIENNLKNIVEFGTSFGISTLYLALGAMSTGGKIITTELLKSKAEKARYNFENAGVSEIIDLKIGDAMETLSLHAENIDLLFLDGWKNLYLDLFNMLEDNFHKDTIIYVDNADMHDTRKFLKAIKHKSFYKILPLHLGKAALISFK